MLNLTVAFFIFMIAAFAETNRLPFDLPEAESELITGYHTEYSAMKFSMFFIAEYANMVTASALMATLFFGGWDIPFTLLYMGERGASTLVLADGLGSGQPAGGVNGLLGPRPHDGRRPDARRVLRHRRTLDRLGGRLTAVTRG